MFDTKQIKQSFSRAARHYDEHAQLQQVIREETVNFAANWPANARILDVGTGTGALAAYMHKHDKGWEIIGLDIAHGMCVQARRHAPQIVNASADALPFTDASFDGVFSSLMLQWINQPLPVLREMARVLRPGGRCVISTFTHGTLAELQAAFTTLDDTPHVSQFMEAMPLSTLAVHAGFMLLAAERETMTQYYPDTMALMKSLRVIGASNKEQNRRKSLMTPRQLRALERFYRERFGEKKGLPVTWEVMYMVLEKR